MNDCAAEKLNYLSVYLSIYDTHIDYLVVLSVWGASSYTFTHLTFDPPPVSTVIGGPISRHLSTWAIWAPGQPPRRLSLSLLAYMGVNPWQRGLAQFDLCFSSVFSSSFFFQEIIPHFPPHALTLLTSSFHSPWCPSQALNLSCCALWPCRRSCWCCSSALSTWCGCGRPAAAANMQASKDVSASSGSPFQS